MKPGTPKVCHFWNNALEWESTFTLGLNAAKSTNYIEKWFKLRLFKIKFSTKNSVETYLYLFQSWSWALQRFAICIPLNYISIMANVWWPLSPLLGDIKVCIHWVFCTKFNFRQLLFEVFFDIIGIFCSI